MICGTGTGDQTTLDNWEYDATVPRAVIDARHSQSGVIPVMFFTSERKADGMGQFRYGCYEARSDVHNAERVVNGPLGWLGLGTVRTECPLAA